MTKRINKISYLAGLETAIRWHEDQIDDKNALSEFHVECAKALRSLEDVDPQWRTLSIERLRRIVFLVGHIRELTEKRRAFRDATILGISTVQNGRNYDVMLTDERMRGDVYSLLGVHLASARDELAELAGESLALEVIEEIERQRVGTKAAHAEVARFNGEDRTPVDEGRAVALAEIEALAGSGAEL